MELACLSCQKRFGLLAICEGGGTANATIAARRHDKSDATEVEMMPGSKL